MPLSPMMRQYMEIKDAYPNNIVLFRLGDFYEMFFEDAKTVSRELELTLTARDSGDGERAPMCGVPYHAVDNYIARLIAKGYRIAICDQTEDPATAKGLVRREVTREITPGTLTNPAHLDESRNNFICSLCFDSGKVNLALADVSTGDIFLPDEISDIDGNTDEDRVINLLSAYMPCELIINLDLAYFKKITNFQKNYLHACQTPPNPNPFDIRAAGSFVAKFDEDSQNLYSEAAIRPLGALLSYLSETQKKELPNMRKITRITNASLLEMNMSTRRSLELVENIRGGKRGSLLWVLDHTKTAAGARILRRSLDNPLCSIGAITARHNAVEEIYSDFIKREELCEKLRCVLDLERLMARVIYDNAGPKDLASIRQTLRIVPEIVSLLDSPFSDLLKDIVMMDPLCDICELLESAICQDPPFSSREGGFIAPGYHPEIDEIRSMMGNGNGFIRDIESRERERTGIKTLKISYNRVFGYFIEVSKSYLHLVPDNYIRKQSISTGERFITSELKDVETNLLSATDRDYALELKLFNDICTTLKFNLDRIKKTAEQLAMLDFIISLSTAAIKYNFTKPDMCADDTIDIKEGRHPVVEQFTTESYFIANDTFLDTDKNRLMLITGPNMAGKSTYMRQIALICIMAQVGSFVPATSARLPVVDRIFTRVGASDDLSSGQSTFMLEMNEVAYIIKNATRQSLIIYDEVGRGTSTFDGMSIARAVAEYTANKIRAKTMFATHYHQLTDMEGQIEGVVNYNISAKKRGEDIIFLRKIVRGGDDDSYGIEVAKLAGLPQSVIKRARQILSHAEQTMDCNGNSNTSKPAADERAAETVNMLDYVAGEIARELKILDINTLTPIEALNIIYEYKKKLK